MKRIILRRGKEASLRRFHPWVFSGAIKKIKEAPEDGEAVEVYSHDGQYLATGHYQEGRSIVVRVCAFQKTDLQQDFWNARLKQAHQYRQLAGLPSEATNCYRLLHGEGDSLPGLIIDIYGGTAVVQCHAIGMHRNLSQIVLALQQTLGASLQAVYDKSKETLPPRYAAQIDNDYCLGSSEAQEVVENKHRFWVDWERGQKNRFFFSTSEKTANCLGNMCKAKRYSMPFATPEVFPFMPWRQEPGKYIR